MKSAPFDLNAVVDQMCRILGTCLGKDISITAGLEPDLWPMHVERHGIEQIIINMAINAREAMPDGGNLNIKTENVTLTDGKWELIPGARPGRFVCLSMTDEGVGMDKQTIRRVFESLAATDGPAECPRLDLSVARGIINRHGGWTNAYSEPGRGSTIKIYIPALSAEAVDQEHDGDPEENSKNPVSGRGEHILVVDDEEEIRRLLTTALTENGYLVSDAADAREALSIFQQEDGNIDLLFSDIVLPGEDGITLAERLVALEPNLPVILTSGYVDEKSEWEVTCERGFEFLRKPFATADLLRAIRQAIDAESVAAPQRFIDQVKEDGATVADRTQGTNSS